MLNCRQVTRLVSQAMDVDLAWYQRLGVRFHLLYCVWCRRYAAQVQFLSRAAKNLPSEGDEPAAQKLSCEAKEKMRARLQEALKHPSEPPG